MTFPLTCFLFDLAQHRKQDRLHSVTVERVLSRLGLVQRLVRDVHDLLENLANVLLTGVVIYRLAVVRRHTVVRRHQATVAHHPVGVLHLVCK